MRKRKREKQRTPARKSGTTASSADDSGFPADLKCASITTGAAKRVTVRLKRKLEKTAGLFVAHLETATGAHEPIDLIRLLTLKIGTIGVVRSTRPVARWLSSVIKSAISGNASVKAERRL